MGSLYSILYRRRDSRTAAHRELVFISGLDVSANDADRIAKMLLDDFGDIVENAWSEAE